MSGAKRFLLTQSMALTLPSARSATSSAMIPGSRAIIYRKDFFAAAGVTPPTIFAPAP